MNGSRLARNDLLVLGVLALLMVGAYFFPWSVVREMLARYDSNKYAFAGIRQDLKRNMQGAAYWGAPTDYMAKAHYAPETGTLRITLSNKHDARVTGLNLRAEFSQAGGPTRSAWLRHEGEGRYSMNGMALPGGSWVMSLTASDTKGPLFRLEQVVNVD